MSKPGSRWLLLLALLLSPGLPGCAVTPIQLPHNDRGEQPGDGIKALGDAPGSIEAATSGKDLGVSRDTPPPVPGDAGPGDLPAGEVRPRDGLSLEGTRPSDARREGSAPGDARSLEAGKPGKKDK